MIDYEKSLKLALKKKSKDTATRVVHTFSLLEKIINTQVDFVFKGGTSLMIILNDMKRFSVDIDILCSSSEFKKLEAYFPVFTKNTFSHYEEDVRKPGNIVKKHFKFFYDENKYILLDIVFDEFKYMQTENRSLQVDNLIELKKEIVVKTPSLKEILTDKLCAFAPTTTGILYSSHKYTEIIKQMFDVARLLEITTSIDAEVIKYYTRNTDQELKRRDRGEISHSDVLIDTIYCCLSILTNNSIKNKEYNNLIKSVKGFRSFTDKNYTVNNARLDSANVFILAVTIFYDINYELPFDNEQKENILDIIRKKEYQSILGKEKLTEIISLLEYTNKESA